MARFIGRFIQVVEHRSAAVRANISQRALTASAAVVIVMSLVGVFEGCAQPAAAAPGSAALPLAGSTGRSAASQGTVLGDSCTSATWCVAVGSKLDGSGEAIPLAQVWNGSRWSDQTTPDPAGSTGSTLDGVSCTSPRACTAVGTSSTSGNDVATLVEKWNGTSWSLQSSPDPDTSNSGLLGVSCVSGSDCMAVGYVTSGTLAEGWNGSSWTVESTPGPSPADLYGVSCRSADACTAVGFSPTTSGGKTLSEVWNGSSWTVESTPHPAGASISQLAGVSCTSAEACIAVGYYLKRSSGYRALIERRNRTNWAVGASSNPASTSEVRLSDVSCRSATRCTAVGYYATKHSYKALAEMWNGSRWSIESTPNPRGGTEVELNGVSCGSRSDCIAVGDYYTSSDTELTFAESWNGTKWTIQRSP